MRTIEYTYRLALAGPQTRVLAGKYYLSLREEGLRVDEWRVLLCVLHVVPEVRHIAILHQLHHAIARLGPVPAIASARVRQVAKHTCELRNRNMTKLFALSVHTHVQEAHRSAGRGRHRFCLRNR